MNDSQWWMLDNGEWQTIGMTDNGEWQIMRMTDNGEC